MLCCAFVHAVHTVHTKASDLGTQRTLSFNLMRYVFTSDAFSGDELIGWHPIFATAQKPIPAASSSLSEGRCSAHVSRDMERMGPWPASGDHRIGLHIPGGPRRPT